MKRWSQLLTLIPLDTAVIADVGTDHGYLAIDAIKNNRAKKVYATDIAQKPLKLAARNIKRAGLDSPQQIHLFRSAGLDFLKEIPETVVDYVVIAGLGSKTIYEIISQPNSKIKNYLLLSNTEVSKLRHWAHVNNFRIQKEDFFYERRRPYWLIWISPQFDFVPLKSFSFGDWNRWYKNNLDYQKYLLALEKRYLAYNKKIKNPQALLKNKEYIQKIASYLKQWN